MSEIPNDPLAQMVEAMGIPSSALEMRSLLDRLAPMLNGGAPEIGAVHAAVPVAGAASGVTADVLVPEGDGPWPVLVYLHGGGWSAGSVATHAKLAKRFAEAGLLVFNVEYRLAPENPFPSGFEDCLQAIRWAAEIAPRYGGDPARLAIGGDSAGGNLSAACAVALAGDPNVDVRATLLIYGVFDFARLDEGVGSEAIQSRPELAAAGADMVELMVGAYLGAERSAELLADPRVSPIHAAAALPPSHVVCGTADPLLLQTRALVERLREAGIEHEHVEVPDMPHGFAQMEFFPQARETIDRMTAFLFKHLA